MELNRTTNARITGYDERWALKWTTLIRADLYSESGNNPKDAMAASLKC
ncbi:unnamed protein product [marine sediment metagenome]|uniref:Uncharacterized protein n=1 Tax=marine sediment metagenome TaxID=412755 RepID=X1UQ10_9ZZZZ